MGNKIIIAFMAAAAMLAAGCSGTRNLTRAKVDMPVTLAAGYADSLCVADKGWWQFYTDTALCSLIDRALTNNRDLRRAAARVEEARELLGVAKAQLLPELGAMAQPTRETEHYGDVAETTVKDYFELKATVAWEFNLWGAGIQNRRQAEAQWLATEEDKRAMQMSLVANVASLYYRLRALHSELAFVKRTLITRQENVRYAKLRFDYGAVSEVVYRQALVEHATTAALVPGIEHRITAANNALGVLLGELPGTTYAAADLNPDDALSVEVPVGLPSELLERRPDLRASEQRLKAAMAGVGVAYANRFPSLRISLQGGLEAKELADFFKSPYSYTLGSIAGSIFDFGKRKRRYKAAIAAYDQARYTYEQNVITAFSEVSDAVSAYQRTCETVELRANLRDAARRYADLALANYRGGNLAYIDVLDAQRRYFDAQTSLINAVRDRYLGLINLYKVLGGGWTGGPAA
ncbi:MAG: efflux transporter outer membrane subunit [[Clostridium] fimetarium]|nr:efflux transporter outer membrane subunit [Alistipes timonensis]MCM1405824.1 efflux transporter outer membrane subunit [[Clostridium] fimetarium]